METQKRTDASIGEAQALASGLLSGRLGRRDFIRRAVALGLSASAVAAALAACGSARPSPPAGAARCVFRPGPLPPPWRPWGGPPRRGPAPPPPPPPPHPLAARQPRPGHRRPAVRPARPRQAPGRRNVAAVGR